MYQVPQQLHGGVGFEQVTHHQDALVFLRQGNKMLGVLGTEGHGFFDVNVFASFQGLAGERVVLGARDG